MTVILALVFIVITLVCFVKSGYDDTDRTVKSKNFAKSRNAMFYKEYKGNVTNTRLVADNRKVIIMGDEVRDARTRQLLYNLSDYRLMARREYLKDKCKKMGLDFYPLCMKDFSKEGCKIGREEPIMVDMNTGQCFYLCKFKEGWVRYLLIPDKKSGRFKPLITEENKHGTTVKCNREYDDDINVVLYRLQHDSYWMFTQNIY